MPPEQLGQLGISEEELKNFKAVRAANDLVREVDRHAIQASVLPFKKMQLSDGDLKGALGKLNASADLKRYVEAKSDYLCKSLPLTTAGKANEVGELFKKMVADNDLGDGLFGQLEGGAGTDRVIAAEIEARATCCLLKSGLLPE